MSNLMNVGRLGLLLRATARGCLIVAAVASFAVGVARAEPAAPPARLALATPASATAPALVDAPAPVDGDAPAPQQPERSAWWVWALAAVAAAGVASIVVLSSGGKDPSCPADRVCK